jgi:hypothetical protein
MLPFISDYELILDDGWTSVNDCIFTISLNVDNAKVGYEPPIYNGRSLICKVALTIGGWEY